MEADLLSDAGWAEALSGVTYVLHTASPFPIGKVEEGSLVRPAVEGTRRVIRAAAAAGVKRVVVTSSVAAVSSGRGEDTTPKTFNEESWSTVDKCEEYPKSKTLAEQEAWRLADELQIEVATINPSYILGPVLSDREASSNTMLKRLLTGDMPAVPRLWVNMVDVRDVAEAHVVALKSVSAVGKRHVLDSADGMWMTDIGKMLTKKFPEQPIPQWTAPWLLVATIALWDKDAAAVSSSIGVKREDYDNARARELLGRPLRTAEESITDMARSMVDMGLATVRRSRRC